MQLQTFVAEIECIAYDRHIFLSRNRQPLNLSQKFGDQPDRINILYGRIEADNMGSESPPRQFFSLRWNNYQNNMTSVFYQLLHTQSFVDVTLACEQSTFRAHKVRWTLVWLGRLVDMKPIHMISFYFFRKRLSCLLVQHISKRSCWTILASIPP